MKGKKGEKAEPRPDDAPDRQAEGDAAAAPDKAAAAKAAGSGEGRSKKDPEGESAAERPAEAGSDPAAEELAVYPLREAAEDARWALRTVWIWIGFALASVIFILTLLILGTRYD
jgi:hypothetical protein